MVKRLFIIMSILAISIPVLALEKAATVNASKGRVEIVHGDAVMGKRAKSGAELVINDILRTKRRGYAEVGFIDGTSVKVFEKSRLTINGIDRKEDGYNAEIQKGKVLFNVEKMANVAGDFRVKTTNSVIGVKGTTFGVVSGGMVTIVEVYNGNVEVLATAGADDFDAGNVDVGSLEGAGKGGDSDANKQTLATSLSSGQGLILSSSGDVRVYEFSADSGGKSLIFQGDVSADKKSDDRGDDGRQSKSKAADEGKSDKAEDSAGTDGAAEKDTADAGGETSQAPKEGGDKGSSIDDILFGAIGLVEKKAAGSDEHSDGGLYGNNFGDSARGNGDLPDGAGLGDLGEMIGDLNIRDFVAGAPAFEGGGAPDFSGVDVPDVGNVVDGIAVDIADVVQSASDFYSAPDTRPDTADQIANQVRGTVNINITFK